MEQVDLGLYFLTYNFIIGVLLVLASEKIGAQAGRLFRERRERASRLVRLGVLTFGSVVSVLMAGVYIAGYILRL